MSNEATRRDDSDQALVVVRVLVPGKRAREHRLPPGRYQIGRRNEADIPLTDRSVSRRHFEIVVGEDGEVRGRDLGSSHGSFLNGRPIQGEVVIKRNAALALGEQRLEITPIEATGTALDRLGGFTEVRGFTRAGGAPVPKVISSAAPPSASSPMMSAHSLPALERSGSKTVVDPTGQGRVFRSMALAALGTPPTDEDLAAAQRASILADLPDEDRVRVLQFAERVELEAGGTVLDIGQTVDELNIVLSGEIQLSIGERSLGSVAQGGAIDLAGAICERPAAATATSEEGATLLRIDAGLLREVIAQHPRLQAFLQRVVEWPGAERLRDIMLEYAVERSTQVEVIASLSRRRLKAGARLNKEGDRAALWILDQGTVAGWKALDGAPALILELAVGSVFGGAEVLADRPLALSFEATSDVELLELDPEMVRALVAQAPELRRLFEAMGPFGSSVADVDGTTAEGPGAAPSADEPLDDDNEAPPLPQFRIGVGPRPLRRPRAVMIRQHDEMDCGAACLAMVAQAYGRRLSLPYYRSMVHVTREGASMWSLVRSARRTGFDVIGIQASPKALMGMYLPAILLFQYHFVVLYKLTLKYALVADPGIGLRKLPLDVFKAQWSGMALLFKPTPRLYEHPESAAAYAKYRVLLRGLLRPMAELCGASLLLFAFGLVTPLFTQIVFDRVLVNNDRTLLNLLMIGVAVVVLFQQTVTAVRTNLTGFVANRFDATFSALVYRHVLKLPLNYFMVRRVGDFLTRLQEITKIRRFLTGDSLATLIQLVSVAVYVGVLYAYDRRLGNSALALVPLIVATAVLTGTRLERILQESFQPRAKAQGFIVEQLRALDTIKALSGELPSRWRWEESLREALRNQFRVDRLRVLTTTMSGGIERLATTAMTFYAASLALRGQLSIGKVIATGQFVASIFSPVRELANRWTSFQETSVALGRVDDIVTATAEPGDHARPEESERLAGDIEFRDVWFQYGSDLSPWVLKGVNLTIKRGEMVAFVGRSGSGKTTLVQLINLLYRPTRGSILIDGKDVTELPLRGLRDSVGIVMQDSTLFAGTLLENITFGHEAGSTDLAMAAARVANAHGFISQLSGGYHHRIEEGGRGLSGGQRQRINIARALYRRPSILILDEATSALDSESERAVVDAMKVFCRGRTSIVIAHRLSTVLHADRIVLLDNGRVVETGTHRELIRKGGAYAQLFGAQLAI